MSKTKLNLRHRLTLAIAFDH